ncbi:MAG: hypothetical protein H7Y00_14885 [Fimbriimonadaceae bacterium]|nr:hypothetical protein [Chitinophagales bacterium]
MPKIDKNKKHLSKEINERFLNAMDQIIRSGQAKNIKDFCDKLPCEVSQVHYMEKGTRYPTIEMLGAIVQQFNISETYLLRGQRPIIMNIYERINNLETAMQEVENKLLALHKPVTQAP